jgi:hypothetical protein
VDATQHLSRAALESGLDLIRLSPRTEGSLRMIVRRPERATREVLCEGRLEVTDGLVGDNWKHRNNPKIYAQLTVMNSRAVSLIAQDQQRWPLAGDQLYVDFDLSMENLPAGSELAIGEAVLRVSEEPHTGCKQFVARFGMDAMEFVNSDVGKQLRLRGLNASIVRSGVVRVGDVVKKL